MAECKPKIEQIKDKLTLNFKDAKIRSLGPMIRFNVEEIDDAQLLYLASESVHNACEIKVKRSGTGLLIVVNT